MYKTFPGLGIGFEEYWKGVLIRSGFKNQTYTAFQDFTSYFPSEAIPLKDIFASTEFTYDMAKKFVDFIAVLKHWGGPPILGDDSTKSSYSVRIYIPNFLFFQWFDTRFLVPNKRIQLEDKGNIRCNIDRKQFRLLPMIERVIGPMWKITRENGKVSESISIYNDLYWSNGLFPFLKKFRFTSNQIRSLRLRWYAIGKGYAPEHKVLKFNDIIKASAELPVSHDQLFNMIITALKKNPYEWDIDNQPGKRNKRLIAKLIQCKELLGRRFLICTPTKYISLDICYYCQELRGKFLSFVENTKCPERGVMPLENIIVEKRNPLCKSVREEIRKRDEKFDIPCIIGRVRGDSCSGDMVFCHVLSALETTFKLEARDGFLGCSAHNREQGTQSLIDFLPEVQEEAEKLGLRF